MPEDRKDRREKMAKEAKTNAMRMLDRQKVKYEAFSYECCLLYTSPSPRD